MSNDKRRAKRQSVAIAGKTYDLTGKPIADCTVRNVSASGAQIEFSRDAADFPAAFVLALSRDAAVRRRCSVVWTLGSVVGVKFSRDSKSGKR